jgi:hypothetical protein
MMCWSGSSPVGCISIRSSMFVVLLVDSRSWIWMVIIIYSHYCTYLPLMLAWVNALLVYTCSSCRCKPIT